MNTPDNANAVLSALAALDGVEVHVPYDEHEQPHKRLISSDEYDDMPVFEFQRGTARVFVVVSRDSVRVSLDWLEADPRGHGHGAAVLRSLLDLADANGVDVVTIPKGGAPKLVAFYERHGFVVEPSGEKWLYRPRRGH